MDWQYFGAAQDQDMERVLARRDQQQALVMRLMQEAQSRQMDERQMSLAERRAMEDKALREASQRSLDDDRRARAEDRKLAGEDRDLNRELGAEHRFQGRLKLLPKGSIIKRSERGDFDKFGASALLKSHVAGDEHGPDEHDEFVGTQDTADAAARLEMQQGLGDARNEIAASRAETAAARAAQAAQGPRPRYTVQQTKDGGLVRVNVETGEATPVQLGEQVLKGAVKTPEQLFEDKKAEAAGRAAGTPAKGGNFLSGIVKKAFGNKPAAAAPAAGASAMVKMRHPKTGATLMVPAAEVAAAEALGAKRIQ